MNDETGGGYWSDYSQSCNDVNNDNFCDDPYPFSGGSVKVIDNYVWTVQDGWLTIINTPADTTVNAVDMSGINHTYSVSATHDGSSMPVTCDIASGALFPIGVNEVLCTADNGIKSTFSVTVNPPPPVIHSNSPCDDGCTHEGNNPDLKIFASGYVEFPVDGVSTISSVWKDPAGIVVYDEILQVNEQGQFNNEFDNPMYIRDMRDSGTYTTMYTYDEVVLDYSWNYLTSVYTPEPDNGPFTLPCSMQENGDGVSSSSCHGFYTNSVARAEIGINYHSGILPIQNYQAVGFFIDGNGTQGQNITVTLDLINPNESKTLVFENTISGFVSEFQMQMLGGSLVTELEPEEPAEQVELDIVAPQVLVPENIVVNTDVMTGEIITFNPTAVDNVDELLTPTCTPQSGSLFPVGVTTVVCTATDAAGNANTNSFTVTIDYKEFAVPNWVKDVAGFWYADDIDDASFLQGIQYLIQNDVIVVPVTESESEGGGTVPAWVKNNAGWWSQGAITDADFVNGIQFLIKDGLIQIN
ncbi:MAG: HYR domain-containing protein [Candidatus Nitrosopelagicus sp.]|nr:HYR domain-containing protein [Candidatus Nitrosopelagicus sp.]